MTTTGTADVQAEMLAELKEQGGELHAIKLGVWTVATLLLLMVIVVLLAAAH